MPKAGPSEEQSQRLHIAQERDITTVVQPVTKQAKAIPSPQGQGEEPIFTVATTYYLKCQRKITKYAKTQESVTHTQEKKHTAKTPCKRDQMSDLTDRLHSSHYKYVQRTKGNHT